MIRITTSCDPNRRPERPPHLKSNWIGNGCDANALPESEIGNIHAQGLLRSQCVAPVERIDFACLHMRGPLSSRVAAHRHVIDVIVDQLKAVQTVPLQLPTLADPRAQRLAELLNADPGNRQSLARVCRTVGASGRTVERLFQEETGMTLGKWRQQLRLMQAMRLLGGAAKVTHAALEAGYSTPSAFIAAFRKSLGTTPAAYFKVSVNGR